MYVTDRATVMAIFVAVGVSLERPVATVNSLCGSGLLILVHDTQELFQTGFQLSFVAVFAILTTVRPLGDLLYRPFQVDPFLPMRLLRPWQRAWHKAMLQTCEALSLSLVCWSATLPILILQEHHISLVAVFTNLLVVPPATLVMLLGVTGLLASTVSGSMAGYLYNTSWLLTKFILLILHSAASIPWHSVNVAPSALLQPDRVTALSEGSDHVFHLRVQGGDWLCNTGTLSHWRSLTEPYLQSQGVNHLDGLILHDPPAHQAEVLEQVISEFPDAKIVSPTQWRLAGERQFVQMEQGNSASNLDPKSARIEIISADAGRGTLQTAAILVHLDQFRILILPSVSEATIADLNCDHVDVVYCGRLRGRRFPRSLVIAKLSPSILVMSGTKPEIMANPRDGIVSPKSLYLKQDGAVTAALLNHELVVRSYRGSELRLRSLSR